MKAAHFVNICTMFLSAFALAQSNPIPFVNQPLFPAATAPGGATFTLTVNGAGFVSGSVVKWNSNPLATTFVSGSQLMATVPASDIAAASTAAVTASNPAPGGGSSNVVYFSVSSPVSTPTFTYTFPLTSPFLAGLAADFNGDGKLDLVVFDPQVCVALGNGDGSFQTPSAGNCFETPTGGGVMLAADFNGDGKLDLALLGSGSPSGVFIALGNGDGTFQKPIFAGVGSLSSSLSGAAVADFNGDGKLDLAVTDSGSPGGVFIALGNGDGTFQTAVNYAAGANAGTIIAGDFNGDGKLDLTFVDSKGPSFIVLLGNGDGTFHAGNTVSIDSFTGIVATADLNRNGKLDLIMADNSSALGVQILLGNGDGTFQAPVNYKSGLPPFSVTVMDVNADSNLDLVANSGLGAEVYFFLGNGDGTFQAASIVSGVNFIGADEMFAGDFNGDGKMDLAMQAQGPMGSQFLVVLLQGSFPALSLSTTNLAFAAQVVGSTSSGQMVQLSNDGTRTMNLKGIAITGVNSGDFAQTSACGTTLAALNSCKISVTFTPTAVGNRIATLSITDDAPGSPQTVALAGTAQDFSLTPSSATTETVPPGQTAKYSVIVTSLGGFAQTVALGCSGAPAQSTCSVSPSSLLMAAATKTATVTVSTLAPTAGSTQAAGEAPAGTLRPDWILPGLLGFGTLATLLGCRKRYPGLVQGLALLLLISLTGPIAACGGSSSSRGGTPPGTYTLTVTGTFTAGSTKVAHTTDFTLSVQ